MVLYVLELLAVIVDKLIGKNNLFERQAKNSFKSCKSLSGCSVVAVLMGAAQTISFSIRYSVKKKRQTLPKVFEKITFVVFFVFFSC